MSATSSPDQKTSIPTEEESGYIVQIRHDYLLDCFPYDTSLENISKLFIKMDIQSLIQLLTIKDQRLITLFKNIDSFSQQAQEKIYSIFTNEEYYKQISSRQIIEFFRQSKKWAFGLTHPTLYQKLSGRQLAVILSEALKIERQSEYKKKLVEGRPGITTEYEDTDPYDRKNFIFMIQEILEKNQTRDTISIENHSINKKLIEKYIAYANLIEYQEQKESPVETEAKKIEQYIVIAQLEPRDILILAELNRNIFKIRQHFHQYSIFINRERESIPFEFFTASEKFPNLLSSPNLLKRPRIPIEENHSSKKTRADALLKKPRNETEVEAFLKNPNLLDEYRLYFQVQKSMLQSIGSETPETPPLLTNEEENSDYERGIFLHERNEFNYAFDYLHRALKANYPPAVTAIAQLAQAMQEAIEQKPIKPQEKAKEFLNLFSLFIKNNMGSEIIKTVLEKTMQYAPNVLHTKHWCQLGNLEKEPNKKLSYYLKAGEMAAHTDTEHIQCITLQTILAMMSTQAESKELIETIPPSINSKNAKAILDSYTLCDALAKENPKYLYLLCVQENQLPPEVPVELQTRPATQATTTASPLDADDDQLFPAESKIISTTQKENPLLARLKDWAEQIAEKEERRATLEKIQTLSLKPPTSDIPEVKQLNPTVLTAVVPSPSSLGELRNKHEANSSLKRGEETSLPILALICGLVYLVLGCLMLVDMLIPFWEGLIPGASAALSTAFPWLAPLGLAIIFTISLCLLFWGILKLNHGLKSASTATHNLTVERILEPAPAQAPKLPELSRVHESSSRSIAQKPINQLGHR